MNNEERVRAWDEAKQVLPPHYQREISDMMDAAEARGRENDTDSAWSAKVRVASKTARRQAIKDCIAALEEANIPSWTVSILHALLDDTPAGEEDGSSWAAVILPFRNRKGDLCGTCDGTDEHEHSRVQCPRCGKQGLRENWPFNCCHVVNGKLVIAKAQEPSA